MGSFPQTLKGLGKEGKRNLGIWERGNSEGTLHTIWLQIRVDGDILNPERNNCGFHNIGIRVDEALVCRIRAVILTISMLLQHAFSQFSEAPKTFEKWTPDTEGLRSSHHQRNRHQEVYSPAHNNSAFNNWPCLLTWDCYFSLIIIATF